MNQTQAYMEVHPSHMPSAQPYHPHGPPSGPLGPYGQHYHSAALLPTGSTYGPSADSYPSYNGYGGMTSPPATSHSVPPPMTSQVGSQILPIPAVNGSNGFVPPSNVGNAGQGPQPFDTTGQIPPPGVKPRVTATLWEDEGSLCFQVEARGICVARRDDNDMINGTKLLNVAGMTRGRRDGILKSEKMRHVVKIGPMHLKGVWIPYDRALEFANKEKITDLLYPLFVHNISTLLTNTANPSRANALITASERRRLDSRGGLPSSQPPPLSQQHPMAAPQQLPAPLSHRPDVSRSHTFPTPPGSSASVIGSHGSGYDWANSGPGPQPLSVDTSIAGGRSLPATPATTPPGATVHGIPSYANLPSYDSKPYYAPASSASQYPTHTTMAQSHELSHAGSRDSQSAHETHSEYMNGVAYGANRASYPYPAAASVGAMAADGSQVPSVMGEPPAYSRPERLHSRTDSHWTYPPPRSSSSNVYSIMSGGHPADMYVNGNGNGSSTRPASFPLASNSAASRTKRTRDDEIAPDAKVAPEPSVASSTEGKRRRTLVDAPRPTIPGVQARPGSSSSVGRQPAL